ncbi:MAG TPA: hypothetical protein VJL90_09430 [Pseudorhodoplanes sp.]|nr:hypothetical protein [Pseudorhodoplanes sp.]
MADTTESRTRALLLTYFPMFIATLSLVTSIYNGYLNGKFVDLVRHNVGRLEYMKSCRDIIEAYFQVKVRLTALSAAGDKAGAEQIEATMAVAKFGALGTYLANLRDETIRVRYSKLSQELEKVLSDARRIPADELTRRLNAIEPLFAEMNDDCVKSAKAMPM